MSKRRVSDEDRYKAAQIWCDDRNAKTVMDVGLAESIAERFADYRALLDEAAEALDMLLDGLDSNADERCGLSEDDWAKRIKSCRTLLARYEEGK